jgi:hypothetical protein
MQRRATFGATFIEYLVNLSACLTIAESFVARRRHASMPAKRASNLISSFVCQFSAKPPSHHFAPIFRKNGARTAQNPQDHARGS